MNLLLRRINTCALWTLLHFSFVVRMGFLLLHYFEIRIYWPVGIVKLIRWCLNTKPCVLFHFFLFLSRIATLHLKRETWNTGNNVLEMCMYGSVHQCIRICAVNYFLSNDFSFFFFCFCCFRAIFLVSSTSSSKTARKEEEKKYTREKPQVL